MRVTESAVAMSGKSSFSHYQESSSVTALMSVAKWRELQEKQSAIDEKQEMGNKKDDAAVVSISDEARNKQIEPSVEVSSKDDQIIRILRRLTEILRQMRSGGRLHGYSDFRREMQAEEMQESDRKFEDTMRRLGKEMPTGSHKVLDLTGGIGRDGRVIRTAQERRESRNNGSNLWVKYTAKSSFVMEQESTVFSTTGIAKTADGREISFNLDLEMSRAFAGSFQAESLENYIMTDPLVINLDNSPAGLSDQKFYFDLNSDGKKEEVSKLRSGSAFLAYDKNGDGIVNDGSELFGTKSGDGFADLAAYDSDGNGWIDEGDDIYSKLKLWSKDDQGNDRLVSLKEADVGAIYLGSAKTDFHLNDATNTTNGMIRQTGIFLRESGGVGTMQHVDLAV